ncbi:MAG: hypothetical protein H6741_03170 [Alphaproteobacteria bacterium]|nr:hypothetical protein [Alphaproteobacteria bacterium]
MPFSAQTETLSPSQLKANLCANARVIAIGVSRYDNFPDQPVTSATANALAWVVQALRMGVSPVGNPLSVEEAEAPEALVEQLSDILDLTDLTPQETEGLRSIVEALRDAEDGWQKWRVTRPTFHNVLWDLIFVGNHLEYTETVRTLVTFSGHGALSGGQLVLCPADAELLDAAPSREAQQARFDGLLAQLAERQAGYAAHLLSVKAELERRLSERYDAGDAGNLSWIGQLLRNPWYVNEDPKADTVWSAMRDTMQSCWSAARRRGVEAEYLDVQEVTVGAVGHPYDPDVMRKVMDFHLKNLRRVAPVLGRAAPAFGRVLTPYHFMLAFGRHDARCTLVLDACHSGGPSESLQGTMAGHDWLRAGVQARILSSSEGAWRSAEARVGVQRFSVATWALTRVLSRWSPVEERMNKGLSAYAMNIRNGELVHRSNMLLHALSFTQHISLHAPPSKAELPSAADMPFFGLARNTRTTTEPSEDAGGIQLSADTNSLTGWVVKVGGAQKAVLVAVGASTKGWSHSGFEFQPGKLAILTTQGNIASIAAASGFTMDKVVWNNAGGSPPPVPPALAQAVEAASSWKFISMNASGGESAMPAGTTPVGKLFQFKKGDQPTVFLSFAGNGSSLSFYKLSANVFMPADFAPSSSFSGSPLQQFNGGAGAWYHTIPVPA